MSKKKEAVNESDKFLPKILPVSERPYEVPENWVWVRLGMYEMLQSFRR